jgi:hypothetical protein
MGSQTLMLENRSRSFIGVKDKILSYFATDKRMTRDAFAGRIVLNNVFGRKSTVIFCAIIAGVFGLE